jgi:GntR family uxuAB operon transcriptional repressor
MQTSDEPGKQRRYLSVAQDLLAAIGNGQYLPGARLPAHTEIAAQYRVSRPTAREAFLALELIGAIEVRHGDGTFVSGSPVRVGGVDGSPLDAPPQELIETRGAIEPVTAGLAAERITADRLVLLERYCDEQAALVHDGSEVARFVELGLQFHADLAPGCGNSLLADIVRQLVNSGSHPLWALVNQQGLPDSASRQVQVDEHRAVLDAVRRGDSGGAVGMMQNHLWGLGNALFSQRGSR